MEATKVIRRATCRRCYQVMVTVRARGVIEIPHCTHCGGRDWVVARHDGREWIPDGGDAA